MDIIQSFYDDMASQYDKLFFDWQASVSEQAAVLDKLFKKKGFDNRATVLDCACGIGTQAIGLASLGYSVTASDISRAEIAQAKARAGSNNVEIRFEHADFRELSKAFTEQFDIVIAMDNALPHMLSHGELKKAVSSITDRIKENGIFAGSIRDYDALLKSKPPYSPPYIHKTEQGQRVSFQTWDWTGDNYRLIQYIIEDSGKTEVSRFECEYRATCRDEITELFIDSGCKNVTWLFPGETGYYQPIVIAEK